MYSVPTLFDENIRIWKWEYKQRRLEVSACAYLLGVNTHQVSSEKEIPPTIQRLWWRTFAYLPHRAEEPHTTVLSKSVGRALALS